MDLTTEKILKQFFKVISIYFIESNYFIKIVNTDINTLK